MPRKPAPHTRERILSAADTLFYQHGFHAVGMQQIIDTCGCGKNLLYREFASKDELVLAYLDKREADWRRSLMATIAPQAGDPRGQLLAMIEAAVAEANDPSFLGCPFARANAEFSDPEHPVHQRTLEQRKEQFAIIYDIALQAGATDPDTLTARLLLLKDGISTNGAIMGREGITHAAIDLARELIDQALESA